MEFTIIFYSRFRSHLQYNCPNVLVHPKLHTLCVRTRGLKFCPPLYEATDVRALTPKHRHFIFFDVGQNTAAVFFQTFTNCWFRLQRYRYIDGKSVLFNYVFTTYAKYKPRKACCVRITVTKLYLLFFLVTDFLFLVRLLWNQRWFPHSSFTVQTQ